MRALPMWRDSVLFILERASDGLGRTSRMSTYSDNLCEGEVR